jgi:hypothetical protein
MLQPVHAERNTVTLPAIVQRLREIESSREETIDKAFLVLQMREPALASMLMENLGDRRRAAYWMCTHRRAFDGRSAYEVLANGDDDAVWDCLYGEDLKPDLAGRRKGERVDFIAT